MTTYSQTHWTKPLSGSWFAPSGKGYWSDEGTPLSVVPEDIYIDQPGNYTVTFAPVSGTSFAIAHNLTVAQGVTLRLNGTSLWTGDKEFGIWDIKNPPAGESVFKNDGLINLVVATIRIKGSVEFEGNGTIRLTGGGIGGWANCDSQLANDSNIEGGGLIGEDKNPLTRFTNYGHGHIQATLGDLSIYAERMVNWGKINTNGHGVLIQSSHGLINPEGILEADAGGMLLLDADVLGGTIASAAGSKIYLGANRVIQDSTVMNKGELYATRNNLIAAENLMNYGSIIVNSDHSLVIGAAHQARVDYWDLANFGKTVVSGTGQLTVHGNVENQGGINATEKGKITFDHATVTNSGTIQAMGTPGNADTYGLALLYSTINNSAMGVVSATTNGELLKLEASTINGGEVSTNPGGKIEVLADGTRSSIWSDHIINDGTIQIDGNATLSLKSSVTHISRNGTIDIDNNGKLVLEAQTMVGNSQTIDFTGTRRGTLVINDVADFHGTVADAAAGTTIDVLNMPYVQHQSVGFGPSADGKNSGFTFFDRLNHIVGVVGLLGQYMAGKDFAVASDLHGGTMITFNDGPHNPIAPPAHH